MSTNDIQVMVAKILAEKETVIEEAVVRVLGRSIIESDVKFFNNIYQCGIESLYYKGTKILSIEVIFEDPVMKVINHEHGKGREAVSKNVICSDEG